MKLLHSTYLFPTEIAKSTREIQKILKYETQLSGYLVCPKTKMGIICGFIKHTKNCCLQLFPALWRMQHLANGVLSGSRISCFS